MCGSLRCPPRTCRLDVCAARRQRASDRSWWDVWDCGFKIPDRECRKPFGLHSCTQPSIAGDRKPCDEIDDPKPIAPRCRRAVLCVAAVARSEFVLIGGAIETASAAAVVAEVKVVVGGGGGRFGSLIEAGRSGELRNAEVSTVPAWMPRPQ